MASSARVERVSKEPHATACWPSAGEQRKWPRRRGNTRRALTAALDRTLRLATHRLSAEMHPIYRGWWCAVLVCAGAGGRWGGSRNNIRWRSRFAPRDGGQPSTSASPISVLAVQLQTKQRRKTSASRAITIEPRSPTSPYEVYSSRTKLPSEKYPGLIYVRLGLLGWAIDRGGATQWCVQAWVAGGQGSDGWGLIFELDVDFGAGDGSLGAVRGALKNQKRKRQGRWHLSRPLPPRGRGRWTCGSVVSTVESQSRVQEKYF